MSKEQHSNPKAPGAAPDSEVSEPLAPNPADPKPVFYESAHSDSVKRWQNNSKRWALMREQTAAANRADRVARGLPVDPPATVAEMRRFMKPIGDATLNHSMVAVGELTLRRALEAAGIDPAALDLPQVAIDLYKIMLSKSMRVDRHGRKYK